MYSGSPAEATPQAARDKKSFIADDSPDMAFYRAVSSDRYVRGLLRWVRVVPRTRIKIFKSWLLITNGFRAKTQII
jgi:hypothetical protein